MMEQIDSLPPYGSFGLEEWIEYNVLHRQIGDHKEMVTGEWKTRLQELRKAGYMQATVYKKQDSAILEDREGLPRWLDEKEFQQTYQIGAKLGRGKYATVFECENNGTKVAAKVFHKKDLSKPKLYQIIKEAIYSRRVAHPRVCRMMDLVETQEQIVIIQELQKGGELYDAIYKAKKHFSEVEVRHLVSQIIDALHHMHDQHIIHCDLKPENILCTTDPTKGNPTPILPQSYPNPKPTSLCVCV